MGRVLEFRVEVMREALRAKFTQHDDLGALLLSTGDARGDGSGANMLGRLLMELRDALS